MPYGLADCFNGLHLHIMHIGSVLAQLWALTAAFLPCGCIESADRAMWHVACGMLHVACGMSSTSAP